MKIQSWRVAILISDKTDLKIRTVTRAEEERYVILKESPEMGTEQLQTSVHPAQEQLNAQGKR